MEKENTLKGTANVALSPDTAGPWSAFISYARNDRETVSSIVEALKACGYNVWFDLVNIEAGDEWWPAVESGIANSNAVIFCVSPDAVGSEEACKELEVAEEFGKRIITLLLRDTPPRDLPKAAVRVQWIDATKGIDIVEIGEVLDRDLDWVERHTYLLRKARDWKSEKRDTSLLLRGKDLANAELDLSASTGNEPHLSKLQVDLIRASHDHQSKWARNRFLIVLSTAIFLGVAAAGFFWQRQVAITKQVDLYTRNGMQAIDDGNLWASGVWFAEALATDAARDYPEEEHRVRLASVQRRLPRLHRVWSVSRPPIKVQYSPSGDHLLAVTGGITILEGPSGTDPRTLHGTPGTPEKISIESGDDEIVLALFDSELAKWNLENGERTSLFLPTSGKLLDFAAGGSRALLIDESGGLQVIEVSDEAVAWSRPWNPPNGQRWLQARLARNGQSVFAITEGQLWERAASRDAEKSLVFEVEAAFRSIWVDATGKYVAASSPQTIHLWELGPTLSGPAILNTADAVKNSSGPVDFEFNPDGKHFLTTVRRNDETLLSLVWSLRRHRNGAISVEIEQRIDHQKRVERWEFNPPSAGGGAAGTVSAGRSRNPFEKLARFSPDGRLLATVSEVDDFVRVWRWRSEKATTPPLRNFGTSISSFGFNSQGTTIAVGGYDDTVRTWRIAIPEGDFQTIKHYDRIDNLVLSPDGSKLAFDGYRANLKIWDLRGTSATSVAQNTRAFFPFEFSPDNRFIAAAGPNQTIQLFDAGSGDQVCEPMKAGHRTTGLSFQSPEKLLAFGGKDGSYRVSVWELPSCRLAATTSDFPTRIDEAAWSPKGDQIAIRFSTSYPKAEAPAERAKNLLWNPDTGNSIQLTASALGIDALHFSKNAEYVWSYDDGRIEEFAADTGKSHREYSVKSPYRFLGASSHDGSVIVVGLYDNQAQILYRDSGEPITPQLDHDERARIEFVALSRDAKRVLTISEEKVRVWSANSGALMAPPFVHDVRVNVAALDSSGRTVAVSSYPRLDGWAGHPSRIDVWSLDSETSDVETLRQRFQMASEHWVDRAGGFVPLARLEFLNRLDALEGFSLNSGEEEALTYLWHKQEAERGDEYGRRFHQGELLHYLERQIDARPKDPVLLQERGRILADLGRLEEANADYSSAIELTPENTRLLVVRAKNHGLLGKLDLALADLSRALEPDASELPIEASWQEIRRAYQFTLLALLVGEQAEASRGCRLAVSLLDRLPPELPFAETWNSWYYAGWSCVLMAASPPLETKDWTRLEEALARYAKIRNLRDVGPDAKLLLGALMLRTGRYDKAKDLLNASAQPPFSTLFLGITFATSGDAELAESIAQEARMASEALQSKHLNLTSPPNFFGPDWPLDSDIALLLEEELEDLLQVERPGP